MPKSPTQISRKGPQFCLSGIKGYYIKLLGHRVKKITMFFFSLFDMYNWGDFLLQTNISIYHVTLKPFSY